MLRPAPHIQPQHLQVANLQPKTPASPAFAVCDPDPQHLQVANLQPKIPASPAFVVCDPVLTSSHNAGCQPAQASPAFDPTPAGCQPAAQDLPAKIFASPAVVVCVCDPVLTFSHNTCRLPTDPCIPSICCLRPSPHLQPQLLQVANLQPKIRASPAFVVCDPVLTSSHNAGCQPAAQDPCISSICCLQPSPHIQPQHLHVANLQPKIRSSPLDPSICCLRPSPHIQPQHLQVLCIPSICCLRPRPHIQPKHLKTPASPAFVVCDPVRTSSHNTCRLPTCSPRSLHTQHLLQPKIPAGQYLLLATASPVFCVCDPALTSSHNTCRLSTFVFATSPHIQTQHLHVANLQPKILASPALVVCDSVLTPSHNTCRLSKSLHPATTTPAGC